MELLPVALPDSQTIVDYMPYVSMDALFASEYYKVTSDYFGNNPTKIVFTTTSSGIMNGGQYCEQYLRRFCPDITSNVLSDGAEFSQGDVILTIESSGENFYRAIAISDTIQGILTTYCSLASGLPAPNFEDYDRLGGEVADHFAGLPVAFAPSWNFVDSLYLENAFRLGAGASCTPSKVYPVNGFNSLMLDRASYGGIMLSSDSDYSNQSEVATLLGSELFSERISLTDKRAIEVDLTDPDWKTNYEGTVDYVVVTKVHPVVDISVDLI